MFEVINECKVEFSQFLRGFLILAKDRGAELNTFRLTPVVLQARLLGSWTENIVAEAGGIETGQDMIRLFSPLLWD